MLPSVDPDAWWLYGLIAVDHPGPDGEPESVAPTQRVEVVDGLQAIVAPARAADWSGAEAEARLADIQQLAPLVTAHHDVVSAWHRAGSIVPVAFASLFGSQAALRSDLAPFALRAHQLLRQFEGHDEIAVKGTLFRARAIEAHLGPAPPRSSGAAWLKHRRARRDAERAVSKQVRDLAGALGSELAPLVRSTRQLATRPTEGEGEPVWSWALLRARAQAVHLDAVLAQARTRAEEAGIELQVGPPMAPWSFASLRSNG